MEAVLREVALLRKDNDSQTHEPIGTLQVDGGWPPFVFFLSPSPLSHLAHSGVITGIVLFGLLLLATLVAALRHWMMRGAEEKCRLTISGTFYALSTVFVTVRLTWFFLVLWNEKMFVEFTLAVVSDLFFFSCFSLIVLHTFENYNKTTVGDAKQLNSTMAWLFLAINVLVYSLQIGVLTYINVERETADVHLIVVSLLVTVIDNLLCGLGFLAFSFRMYCSQKSDNTSVGGLKAHLRRTMVVSFIMTLCFAGRAVLYVLQVATPHAGVDDMLYVEGTPRLLLVCASEIIPIAYQLFSQRAKKKQENIHETFIQSLYDDSHETSTSEGDPLLLSTHQSGVN